MMENFEYLLVKGHIDIFGSMFGSYFEVWVSYIEYDLLKFS